MKTSLNNTNRTFDIHLLELVRLRIGYLNECSYSINIHYNELKNFGETDERLSLVSVWNQVPHFSKKECALFSLTDYIINPSNALSIEEVQNILVPHFNKDEVSDLTQAIKQISVWTSTMKHLDFTTSCKKI